MDEIEQLKKENAELYSKLAAAELDARLGWERYEQANRKYMNLSHQLAQFKLK